MKICIDPGHGGQDRGASFRGVDEADIVLLTGLCLEKLLASGGHEVLLSRSIDEYIALSERVKIANNADAAIFISLHCNADPDPDDPGMPEGKGEEIWIYQGSPVSRNVAEALARKVENIFPSHRFRGIKETAVLYVLRKTSMPAVLLELGFIDNMVEGTALSRPASYMKIAKLIAEGLDDYLKEQ
jgi:N-acetylmuramoyl-L-alanine amidase